MLEMVDAPKRRRYRCDRWRRPHDQDLVRISGLHLRSQADPAPCRNPLSGATPSRTLRPAASLGIVGLAVDPSAGGANFLVSGSIDSVLCRWSMDGIQEARKELGPCASCRPRT